MSVVIKFDDEVQTLLLLSSFPNSWSGTVTPVISSAKSDGFTFFRRFMISFLARMFKEGVLGNYLVNRYMSSEVRKISKIVGARTKKESVKDSGLLKCNMLELLGGGTFQESMPK